MLIRAAEQHELNLLKEQGWEIIWVAQEGVLIKNNKIHGVDLKEGE